jgi:hypothetical protein
MVILVHFRGQQKAGVDWKPEQAADEDIEEEARRAKEAAERQADCGQRREPRAMASGCVSEPGSGQRWGYPDRLSDGGRGRCLKR